VVGPLFEINYDTKLGAAMCGDDSATQGKGLYASLPISVSSSSRSMWRSVQ